MNVILFSLYCLLSYLSLVMLSLLLCECHLVFLLLSFVTLNTCSLSFSYVNVILSSLYCLFSYLSLVMLSLLLCECHLVFPLLSFVILITCYVKFSPMWMSSCLLLLITCYVKFVLTLSLLLSYLSLVMLSLLLCECHLVFPLLSFVILITCYVKFAPMWMSSCFPSIVFCHTYHLLC